MLDPRTIETLFAEAVALQDWDTVAVCERAMTGIVSVATMKRLSPEACVVVQVLELRLAGVSVADTVVPRKYVEISELSQDKAIALLEAKLGQRVDLDERERDYIGDGDVELEIDVDVSDLDAKATELPPTPRMVRVFSGLDLTELDNQDDDKTVVPS